MLLLMIISFTQTELRRFPIQTTQNFAERFNSNLRFGLGVGFLFSRLSACSIHKMRVLEHITPSPFSLVPLSQNPNSNSSSIVKGGSFSWTGLSNWLVDCHGFLHNFVLIACSLCFVLYLSFQSKKSFTKLLNGRSHIMIAYYGCVWLVCLLNLAWCCLQAWECTPGKELIWNILSLFTLSGMLFLEVSLLAFLFQGSYACGPEALTRTFGVSGLIVGLDIILKAVYLFGFGIPLFVDSDEQSHQVKWGLWFVHRLVLTAVYGFILFMYHSSWRERLPARPTFYKYISIMFILNALSLFACGLTGNVASFGFWVYGATIVCYHAFYLPLLYVTFLQDFFQEEDLHLKNVYYSEMKDAGFFDADWE